MPVLLVLVVKYLLETGAIGLCTMLLRIDDFPELGAPIRQVWVDLEYAGESSNGYKVILASVGISSRGVIGRFLILYVMTSAIGSFIFMG
jgi:hypothetical protein